MSLRITPMSCLEGDCTPLPSTSSRVIEVNDLSALESYRLAWDSLVAQSPQSNFFQTLDWLKVYWRHFGKGCRLRVMIVQVRGKTIGILPLVVRTEWSKVGPLRTLNYPLHDWGSFYGPIGPNPTATLLAGLGHLRRTKRDWDVLDLRWIDEDGADRGRTHRALEVKGFSAYRNEWAESAVIDLAAAGDWESYWAGRTSKWRTNVRRNEKRLAEMGEVRHVRYRPLGSARGEDDPRWDLYDTCEEVARRSWQGDSTKGTTLTHESVRAFLRDAHEAAVKAGCVDLNLLYVNDKPVAFNYCYHFQGRLFGLRMGFDRSTGADGAGSVLLYRVIQNSFDRDDRVLDLGADYLDCKRPWLTRLAKSYRYTHYPPVISRAQIIHAKRWMEGWFSGTTSSV